MIIGLDLSYGTQFSQIMVFD